MNLHITSRTMSICFAAIMVTALGTDAFVLPLLSKSKNHKDHTHDTRTSAERHKLSENFSSETIFDLTEVSKTSTHDEDTTSGRTSTLDEDTTSERQRRSGEHASSDTTIVTSEAFQTSTAGSVSETIESIIDALDEEDETCVQLPLASSESESQTTGHNSNGLRRHYESDTCSNDYLDISRMRHPKLNQKSTCPFVYYDHVDNDRYPRQMTFAQCHCPSCILPDSSGFDETSGNACRPVYHKVKVHRKCLATCDDNGGNCRYRSDYEDVPVACACVRPKIHY